MLTLDPRNPSLHHFNPALSVSLYPKLSRPRLRDGKVFVEDEVIEESLSASPVSNADYISVDIISLTFRNLVIGYSGSCNSL